MFIGEYQYSIDEKGRVAIPAKFRAELAVGCIVTRGLDNSLVIYSKKEWNKMAKKLASLPFSSSDARALSRLMLSGAMDVETDKQGRILIPEYLRDYAELKTEVVICGVYNRLEVWSEEKWHEYKAEKEEKAVTIVEELGEKDIKI